MPSALTDSQCRKRRQRRLQVSAGLLPIVELALVDATRLLHGTRLEAIVVCGVSRRSLLRRSRRRTSAVSSNERGPGWERRSCRLQARRSRLPFELLSERSCHNMHLRRRILRAKRRWTLSTVSCWIVLSRWNKQSAVLDKRNLACWSTGPDGVCLQCRVLPGKRWHVSGVSGWLVVCGGQTQRVPSEHCVACSVHRNHAVCQCSRAQR